MACTADEDAVGYLNDIDEKFGKAGHMARFLRLCKGDTERAPLSGI